MRKTNALAALTWAVLAIPLAAQEEKQVTIPFDGPDFFCHVLFSKGLTPLPSYEHAVADPKDSIVIFYGVPTPGVMAFTQKSLKGYRDRGGSVFIATDRAMGIVDLGVQITGGPVYRPKDVCYGEDERCPLLGYEPPSVDGITDTQGHPLFGLLHGRLATNCPSNLRVMSDSPLRSMLHLPRFFKRKDFKFGPPAPPPPIFPASAYIACSPKDAPPSGRALVIAGHGLLINGMMLQPDTDNLSFAINAVEWLREAPRGEKRTQALLVVDGQIISNFDRNLSPPPPPIPLPTVAMLNRLMRGLEDEGFFHLVFKHVLGNHYNRAVPFLFSICTCALLLYGAKKVLEGRSIIDTAVPQTVGVATALGEGEPRSQQRQAAMYRQKDAGAEARLLANMWLQSEFGLGMEQLREGVFRVSGSIWTRWRLRRQADFVLELTHTASPIEVSRAQFAAFVRSLPTLIRAIREGRVTLLLDGKEVRKTSEPKA